MAQYKVPQDVEADDKLIGPFSFRQFVYLLVAAGLIAVAVGLFQIFPLLAIIPVPFILLLGALALPLKKDQPMEAYLAALVSYFLKPRTRIWVPGQSNSIITVTAPKRGEEARTRDITGEEATNRLSFLAGIVDTKGYAIKGFNSSTLNDDILAETYATNDMFETGHFDNLVETISKDETARHEDVVREMREEIRKVEENSIKDSVKQQEEEINGAIKQQGDAMQNTDNMEVVNAEKTDTKEVDTKETNIEEFSWRGPNYDSDVVVRPLEPEKEPVKMVYEKKETPKAESSIIRSVGKDNNQTKERGDDKEVFISLH